LSELVGKGAPSRAESSSMGIHVYACSWNEIRAIDFFLRHYESFAERIVVYDEDSDDGTRDILAAHKNVDVRRFVRANPSSLELSKLAIQNECWKEARKSADWVIIVDIDEHVFHPRLMDYLAKQKRRGVTFVPTLGFQMITEQFPEKEEHLASTRTMGCPNPNHSKPCVFDPAAIAEVNFGVGLHQASPVGRLKLPAQDEVMLLHYKYLGLDYVVQRYGDLVPRRGAVDLENRWDFHFDKSPEQWRQLLSRYQKNLMDIASPGFSPSAVHGPPSWRTSWLRRVFGNRNLIIKGPT
jgi:hypothetical protein